MSEEFKIDTGITEEGVKNATALHLTFNNKFFEDFQKKFKGLENCTYTDVVIMWEGLEYRYSIFRFKELLGLAP